MISYGNTRDCMRFLYTRLHAFEKTYFIFAGLGGVSMSVGYQRALRIGVLSSEKWARACQTLVKTNVFATPRCEEVSGTRGPVS